MNDNRFGQLLIIENFAIGFILWQMLKKINKLETHHAYSYRDIAIMQSKVDQMVQSQGKLLKSDNNIRGDIHTSYKYIVSNMRGLGKVLGDDLKKNRMLIASAILYNRDARLRKRR